MDDGMGLVERLKSRASFLRGAIGVGIVTAEIEFLELSADRIEQLTNRVNDLERELAEVKKANIYMDAQHQECRDQLAAEKALADRLARVMFSVHYNDQANAVAAYRKARKAVEPPRGL